MRLVWQIWLSQLKYIDFTCNISFKPVKQATQYMRFFYFHHILFLFLCCFLLFSIKAQTDDIPIPQRKKGLVEYTQPRQIIEMQEIGESIPIPKRKKGVERKLGEYVKEAKNEIRDKKNVESKDNESLVIEIIDSIREKVTKCWSIPEGIVYKESLSIKINLLLSSKGEIIVADVVDSSSYKDNPLFRSVADNAMRALYKCSPLIGLPAEHYHIWREVTLDFILNK